MQGYSLDVDGMAVHLCLAIEAGASKCMIGQKRSRMGCFGSEQYEQRSVLGGYSGTLLFPNLHGNWSN